MWLHAYAFSLRASAFVTPLAHLSHRASALFPTRIYTWPYWGTIVFPTQMRIFFFSFGFSENFEINQMFLQRRPRRRNAISRRLNDRSNPRNPQRSGCFWRIQICSKIYFLYFKVNQRSNNLSKSSEQPSDFIVPGAFSIGGNAFYPCRLGNIMSSRLSNFTRRGFLLLQCALLH